MVFVFTHVWFYRPTGVEKIPLILGIFFVTPRGLDDVRAQIEKEYSSSWIKHHLKS